MKPLIVEPAESDLVACACCAGEGGLRGFVYEGAEARAVYCVEPIGATTYPMIKLGIAVGEWGPGSPVGSRVSLALVCKPTPNGPGLTPAEPKMLAFPELETLGLPLSAAELPHAARRDDLYGIARAIIDQDRRLAAIREAGAAPGQNRRFSAEPG